MSEKKLINTLCDEDDTECVEELKKLCPDLDDQCLSGLTQMDYFLVGRENYNLPKKKVD
jgi:hypothetical protein